MNLYGFSSIKDYFWSVFGIKYIKVNIFLVPFILILNSFIGFFDAQLHSLVTLYMLMFFDGFTGTLKAIRAKEFSSRKFLRIWIMLFTNSLLLYLSWMMGESNWFFQHLPHLLFGGFFSTYIISLMENLGELNLLPRPMINMLKSRFGLKALVKKYDKID